MADDYNVLIAAHQVAYDRIEAAYADCEAAQRDLQNYHAKPHPSSLEWRRVSTRIRAANRAFMAAAREYMRILTELQRLNVR